MQLPYKQLSVFPYLTPSMQNARPPFQMGEPFHISVDDATDWTRGPGRMDWNDGAPYEVGILPHLDKLYLVASVFPETTPLEVHMEGLQTLSDTPMKCLWFHSGRTSMWWKKHNLQKLEFKVGLSGVKALEDAFTAPELATLLPRLMPSRKVGTLLEVRPHPSIEANSQPQLILLTAI